MNRVASLVVLLALVLLFGGLFYLVVFRFFVPLFLAALFALLFEHCTVGCVRAAENINAALRG